MLRVGTDCSGLDSPIWALKRLGIEHRHVFSSEVNLDCVKTILANHSPEILYGDPNSTTPNGDISGRDMSSTPPCDLYVCGFPCQPFSVSGSLQGVSDPRGTIFWSCVKYIETHRPKWFVLENVKNLIHMQGGKVFESILKELSKLSGYEVSHSVLNTKEYGIPQSRNRLYIVGVRDADEPFSFPPKSLLPHPPPEDFVDYEDTSVTTSNRADVCRSISEELTRRGLPGVFFDALHMQRGKKDIIQRNGYPHVPCITCNSYHWNTIMNRRANVKELLSLQGLPHDLVVTVSDTAIRRQIGNSMSCNVLMSIFKSLGFASSSNEDKV